MKKWGFREGMWLKATSAQLAVAVPICVTPTPLNHEGEGAVGAPLWVQPN